MPALKTLIVLIALSSAAPPSAQAVNRTLLPADHPLLGAWRYTSKSGCVETYNVRRDGSTRITRAEQELDAESDISTTLTDNGFFKWVAKITRSNGKPDCAGATSAAGSVSTYFIRIHRNGGSFILCGKEDLDTCVGPFVQQRP